MKNLIKRASWWVAAMFLLMALSWTQVVQAQTIRDKSN